MAVLRRNMLAGRVGCWLPLEFLRRSGEPGGRQCRKRHSGLLGLRDDSRTVVEVGAMSEGTTDQLFLAIHLAAVEQSAAAGVRLPLLADDLFVNFDDERSEAGF